MKRTLIVTAILAVAAVLSQSPAAAETTVQNGDGTSFVVLSPMETKELIETREDLQMVDVRTEGEYRSGALPGSRLVTWSSWSPQSFLGSMQTYDKEKPLLLICAVGGRSFAAAQLLSRSGFKEVYNLDKGLQEWVRLRVPLPAKAPATSQ